MGNNYDYMMKGTWRHNCAPIITATIKANRGKSEKEIRKALREAYPYGQREYHPYKIWCDEVRIQLGKKRRGKTKIQPENQGRLF